MNEKLKNLLDLENEKYINKTKNSFIKHQASQNVMPGGNTRTTQWMDPYPFFVKNASGLNIHDIDGNNYLFEYIIR